MEVLRPTESEFNSSQQCCFSTTIHQDAESVSYINVTVYEPGSALDGNYTINLLFPIPYITAKEPFDSPEGTNATCSEVRFLSNATKSLRCQSSNATTFSAVFGMLIPANVNDTDFKVNLTRKAGDIAACTETTTCAPPPQLDTHSSDGSVYLPGIGYTGSHVPIIIGVASFMGLCLLILAAYKLHQRKSSSGSQVGTSSKGLDTTLNNVLDVREKNLQLMGSIQVQILDPQPTPELNFAIESYENLTIGTEPDTTLHKQYNNSSLKGTDNLSVGIDCELDALVMSIPSKPVAAKTRRVSKFEEKNPIVLEITPPTPPPLASQQTRARKISNVQELKAKFEKTPLPLHQSRASPDAVENERANEDNSSKVNERKSATGSTGSIDSQKGRRGKHARKSKMEHRQQLLNETVMDYAETAMKRTSKDSLNDN
ncbi:hypothetical protein HDU80_006154 [Chytriomyces hyalinus]|nr:hypothetical protein HDU80_006154 [Chytriomyces hyalinus]